MTGEEKSRDSLRFRRRFCESRIDVFVIVVTRACAGLSGRGVLDLNCRFARLGVVRGGCAEDGICGG